MPLGLCAQIACLLANGFFCTFPARPVRRSPPLAPPVLCPVTHHPLHSPSQRLQAAARLAALTRPSNASSDPPPKGG